MQGDQSVIVASKDQYHFFQPVEMLINVADILDGTSLILPQQAVAFVQVWSPFF